MNYLKIDTCNMNNGDGLRCVVWVSGCEHECKNCFNPETWNKDNGDEFTGTQWELICNVLQQDWCSGITFTGGDPFHPCNFEEIFELCTGLKEKFPTKTIWVYTGYSLDGYKLKLSHKIFEYIDVLVDGEYVDNLKSPFKHWVGSSNQRVIDIKQSIATNSIVTLQ